MPHRQWVFTIPKRLRVYFRYDRNLLGKLCRAAYDTVCEIFKQEIDGDCGVPAMVATAQTFGDLIHWRPQVLTFGVQVSRGCPYGCNFCLVRHFFGKRQRYRNSDNVVEEISSLPPFYRTAVPIL